MTDDACSTKKAFLANADVLRAAEIWRGKPDDLRILRQIYQNWRRAENGALSKERFRGKWIQHNVDRVLQSSAYVTEDHRFTDLYRPTTLAFFLLVATESEKCRDMMSAIKKIFDSLRKAASLSGCAMAELPLEKLVASTALDRALIESTVVLLRDALLGIQLFHGEKEAKKITVSQDILKFRNVWEYARWLVRMAFASVASNAFAVDVFDQPRQRQFAQILAVVPDGADLLGRCLERIDYQPDGAITSARSLVEATLKWVAHDADGDTGKGESPAKLFEASIKAIKLAPDSEEGKIGVLKIVEGINTESPRNSWRPVGLS